MARHDNFHWRAPTLILGSLLAGISLAIGHHAFYRSLAGNTVPVADHTVLGISKQKMYSSAGTAFAFVTKSSFAIAVSTAYVQLFWRTAKERATTVETLDSLLSAPKNALLLFDPRLWWRYPFLLCIALNLWLIPIASIVPPATLTIETVPAPPKYSLIDVPAIDFNSLNFAFMPDVANKAVRLWYYYAPQYSVTKIVTATAAQGNIMSIPALYQNSSWTLEFPGPVVKCDNVSGPLYEQILDQIISLAEQDRCSNSFGYLSWLPYNDTQMLPFEDINGTITLRGTSSNSDIEFSAPRGQPRVFVGTFPRMDTTYSGLVIPECEDARLESDGTRSMSTAQLYTANASILSCGLHSTTYRTNVAFHSGIQTMDIDTVEPYKKVIALDSITLPELYPTSKITYPNGSTSEVETYNNTIGHTLAYQSVFDAFSKILSGSISTGHDSSNIPKLINTTIMSSVLSGVQELAFLQNYGMKIFSMQSGMQGHAGLVSDSTPTTLHMQDAIEQLFQNITMSLMASPLLQYSKSSPYSPPLTNVIIYTLHNVYVYTPNTLWLAYGSAILVCSLSVLAGLGALLSNGASYSCDFSTLLRTSRHAELTVEVHSLDTDGSDPLPRYLAKAKVAFDAGVTEERKLGDAVPLVEKNAASNNDF